MMVLLWFQLGCTPPIEISGSGPTDSGLGAADGDGDGFLEPEDCDDEDSSVHPDTEEIPCDGLDNDCDGLIDPEDPTWYYDDDGDSWGTPLWTTTSCTVPTGYAFRAGDCDDGDPTVYPGAPELCDEQDNDCDTAIDEEVPPTWYTDTDGDGYGNSKSSVSDCEQPDGTSGNADDCDDTDDTIYPEAPELCDGLDNDCDGATDEDTEGPTWYTDSDEDGYGDPLSAVQDCEQPSGTTTLGRDCDDEDPAINPDEPEVCDGDDNDCDGLVDDEDPGVDTLTGTSFYADGDGDGYGDPSVKTMACVAATGWVTEAGDCDDSDASVNPGATEVCDDGLDNDCDGTSNGCGLSGTLSLSRADAKVAGESTDDYATYNTGLDLGDANGDGLADLLVGAYNSDAGGSESGRVYLVHGPISDRSLGSADATWTGREGDHAGVSLALVGDGDGDGHADLLVGAYTGARFSDSSKEAGVAYLLRGPLTGGDLADADLILEGDKDDELAGAAVASVGDADGDGLDDLLVGVPWRKDGSDEEAGTAYLVPGSTSGTHKLKDVGWALKGQDKGDEAGSGVASAGDLDGDGVSELLVGAPWSDRAKNDSGSVYLVYGPVTGDLKLQDSDGIFTGESADDWAGLSMAGELDLNNDGYGDFLVGARYADDTSGANPGAAYVILGPAPSGEKGLGGAHAILRGELDLDAAGHAVCGAGDVDGDGTDDLLVSAYDQNSLYDEAGAVYLGYGPVTGIVDLGDLDLKLTGEYGYQHAGTALAGGADINGDGLSDFAVGAWADYSGGSGSGAVMIVLGSGI